MSNAERVQRHREQQQASGLGRYEFRARTREDADVLRDLARDVLNGTLTRYEVEDFRASRQRPFSGDPDETFGEAIERLRAAGILPIEDEPEPYVRDRNPDPMFNVE